ncbi:amidohydrolase family protein [Jiangella sp. DSM 45060]|uniref:amidohydrolase family protein n=1 Tax=Jiangella sp. DSM 45060 TaxID=1798224 RepID=UPI0008799681|nr:amidohydrolase family protein [Jiangella sp. DSM 45060]SDS31743.1 Predicted metal-dependent hydrolase, TIM-barrel fold [Jiangella sp. DSM 45060]
MIIDAHVRLGPGRSASLDVAGLTATMDRLGIDRALVAPGEYATAWDNRAGNDLTTAAAAASDGRLVAYAVANPWAGADAVAELARARDLGARALAVDAALQGFELLDGLIDPLLAFAQESGWLVYVRTGTPPHAVPLPLASLARRWPELSFVMGRSGATDFWIDAAPALRHAPNLYGDTCYAPWDTVLSEFARDPEIGAGRLVFSTDAPYTAPEAELARITGWPIPDDDRAAVLGGTLAGLLG